MLISEVSYSLLKVHKGSYHSRLFKILLSFFHDLSWWCLRLLHDYYNAGKLHNYFTLYTQYLTVSRYTMKLQLEVLKTQQSLFFHYMCICICGILGALPLFVFRLSNTLYLYMSDTIVNKSISYFTFKLVYSSSAILQTSELQS